MTTTTQPPADAGDDVAERRAAARRPSRRASRAGRGARAAAFEHPPHETQRIQLRCGSCRNLFDSLMPVGCRVSVTVAAMAALRCPRCGGSRVLLGQGRSLAEDRAFPRGDGYEGRVSAWPLTGEVGASAEAIHRHMTGRPQDEGAAPHDVDDVARCMLLLDRVPEWSPRMGEMASVSPEWARLAPLWAELEEAYRADEAALGGGRYPETFAVLSTTRGSGPD